MQKSLLVKIIAVLALAAGNAQANVVELVHNGSFELTHFSGAWTYLDNVPQWMSSLAGSSAFEIQKGATQGGLSGFNATAADGSQYLELNTTTFTSVSQRIETAKPGTYSLSFAYSGRPDTAGHAASAMNVYWGNQLLTASPLIGNTSGNWDTITFNNLAISGHSTLLRFESVGPASSPSYGSYLDNVSVTASSSPVVTVPEPETYGMMLAGLAMLGLVARRKK